MHRFPLPLIYPLALALPATAQITSNWTGATDQQWDNFTNWDNATVPNNFGGNTYDAFLGGGAGLVFVNANNTLESLTMQVGASLSISDGFTFTVRESVTNGGSIFLEGDSNISRLSISDSSGDLTVQLSGIGTIFLDDPFDQIAGTNGHTLNHIGGHTIRGHGNLGANTINIENSGFVIADSPGNTLFVDPWSTFDNSGFLWAHGGGELELLPTTYTNTGLGELSIDDGSEIRLNAVTLNGGTVKALQQNGIAEDNRLVVSGNSTLTDVTVETATFVDNGRTLTLNGTGFTNHGPIWLESAANISRLSFHGSVGNAITLDGNGTILLDNAFDQITGTNGHTLTHEAPHSIAGGGAVGANALNVINQGTVTATSASVPLVIDPWSTWINDGGTLWAGTGSIVQLNPGTYSCATGGRFLVGDGSTFELNGITAENSSFDIDNGDSDPLNHLLRVTANSTLDACVSDAVIRVDEGRTLTIREDLLVNDAEIHLDGGSNLSSLTINGGGDLQMELGGTGTLFLDNGNDRVNGTNNHTLVQAATHRIEGHGQLGANSINFINQGAIEANVTGQELIVDPFSGFINDAGTLTAASGATTRFENGSYGVANGGRFVIGDASTFDLRSGTWSDLTLEIDDQDADSTNHFVAINAATTFNRVTQEAVLAVANGLTLTLNESLTNQQRIDLNSTTNLTQLSFNDSSDQQVELDGSGLIRLDSDLDRITGTAAHTLVQGAAHRITGGGRIGMNVLNLMNQGAITADLPGTPLIIDPRSTFLNDGGSLTAEALTLLRLLPGTYETANGGTFTVGEDAEMRFEGATMRDLTLAADDSDGDLLDHHGRVTSNTFFARVVNELALLVDESRVLTLQEGDFTNVGTISLGGATNTSDISINGSGVGNMIGILGDGEILLDSGLDRITGTSNHLLIHGADHSISGFGQIGTSNLNIRNHGTIRSSIAGETLTFDPRSTFVNDGGVLDAEDLAVIRFNPGTYSSENGGLYSIGEDALLELNGVTLEDLTLTADNTVGTFANHFATVLTNSNFRRITNGLALNVEDARTLTLAGGDSTNHGEIRLDGATNPSSVSINGTGVGNTITLGGTGSIQLDSGLDRITGISNHRFINGLGHRIEGSGKVGTAALLLRNEGLYNANRNGESLEVDVRSGSFDNRGILQAQNGGVLDIMDPVSDTNGTIAPMAGSTIQVSGVVTQTSGTTAVDGTLAATSLTLEKSLLKGTGLIDNPVSASFSTVSPGNSTGTLTIDDATTLSAGTSLAIEINATADHDLLAITTGPLQLNGGVLRLDYLGGPTDVSGSDILTIATASGGVSNEFINISDGERLYTVSGVASFIVNYEPNAITLTEFIYDPAGPPNQPPVITAFVENLNIDENTPIDTLLATFAAYDPEGVPIEFTLNDPSAPFAIDLLNGELRVSDLVNHEEEAVYNLVVGASDTINTSSVLLTITVNDLIDTNSEIVEDLLTQAGGDFEGETDPAIIAYDADPDGDGRINVFELWRGTDPAVPDPAPVLLAPYFVSDEDRASVTLDVDTALDDQLAIRTGFSFDLSLWRDAGTNREILGQSGGVRTLRFYDSLPLGDPHRFFARFRADADGEP